MQNCLICRRWGIGKREQKMDNRLKYYKKLWGLSDDGDAFTTHSGLLQPVLYIGKPCMLKITTGNEERQGNNLMVWWNGNGAAPVLKHDEKALLMERATGQNSLAEIAKNDMDDKASRIICSVATRLHAHTGPSPTALMPLDVWFKDLQPAAYRHGGVFLKCSETANKLLNDRFDQVILHGDIHHGNILDFGSKGWLAIDPKGLLGERGFDYANLFCNPEITTATKPGRLARQVKVVSEEACLDPRRLLQWIVAWAGLSAAWSLDDSGNAEPAMTVAGIALNELDKF